MISLLQDPEFDRICKVSFAIEDNDHGHLSIGAILNYTDPGGVSPRHPFPSERKDTTDGNLRATTLKAFQLLGAEKKSGLRHR